ncbi:GNAT family N-acetyltransferase [Nesterenkonia halotolerans]|uniref:GNAT family N-acetyltransferase n=1 Tax=Nesterenkonia halotolerans TaxID=225325 RepID=UPI003626B92C
MQGQDAEVIHRLIQDPEIAVLTGSVHSSTPQQSPWSMGSLRPIYEPWSTADDRLVLAVIEQKTGAMVGEVVLKDSHEENRSCGFRTLIGPEGHGKGLGTEATRMIIRYGLQSLGLHRISLEVYDFNPRARHVYEKVGFTHKGTGRDALRFEERWIDVHYMSILESDIASALPRRTSTRTADLLRDRTMK